MPREGEAKYKKGIIWYASFLAERERENTIWYLLHINKILKKK